MRSATRALLSLSAALALVVSTIGTAAAAPVGTRGSALVNAEVMGIFRGRDARPSKPQRTNRNNLSSHGGPVETTPAVYIVYWGSEWGSGFTTGTYTSAQAQTYNEGFFSNVGGSSWNNVVKQYCQGVSSGTQTCPSSAQFITNPAGQLKGTWSDTASSVPNSPTQSQIAAEAVRAMGHFGYNANATYLVYTPTGKSMNGFGTQWCAWHSSTSSSSGTVAYGYIPYMPDAGASCGMNFVNGTNDPYGEGYFDGFSVVAGHEYSEAETDPHPSSGWVDRQGAENADKCAWSSGSTNITLGGKQYAVQPTWSNAKGGCAISA